MKNIEILNCKICNVKPVLKSIDEFGSMYVLACRRCDVQTQEIISSASNGCDENTKLRLRDMWNKMNQKQK